jgi:hypothetical protein
MSVCHNISFPTLKQNKGNTWLIQYCLILGQQILLDDKAFLFSISNESLKCETRCAWDVPYETLYTIWNILLIHV